MSAYDPKRTSQVSSQNVRYARQGRMSQKEKVMLSPAWRHAGYVIAILAAQGLMLHLMGRLAICSCGYVKLWEGNPAGPETSQHLTDWYTFSHLLHGFWLYFFLWLMFSRLPISARLVLAVLLEAGWEIVENTPFIIQRYRADTISAAYYGDTIVNSLSDTLTAVVGFLFAAWVPPTVNDIGWDRDRGRTCTSDPRQPHSQHRDARSPGALD